MKENFWLEGSLPASSSFLAHGLACPVPCLVRMECGLCALCHTCIQFCIFQNKHCTYLGQQVPNHCICQVSLGSPGPAYGTMTQGRRVYRYLHSGGVLFCFCFFFSCLSFYLCDFFPGSLHSTETKPTCGRCGKVVLRQQPGCWLVLVFLQGNAPHRCGKISS